MVDVEVVGKIKFSENRPEDYYLWVELIYKKGFMYFAEEKYDKNVINQKSHLSGEGSRDLEKVYPKDFVSVNSLKIL